MADSKISTLTDGTSAQLTTDRIPVARTPYGTGDNRYLTPAYIRQATGGPLAGTTLALGTAGSASTPTLTIGGSVGGVFYTTVAGNEAFGWGQSGAEWAGITTYRPSTFVVRRDGCYGFSSGFNITGSSDLSLGRAGAGALVVSQDGVAGGTDSSTLIVKSVANIADNTFTSVLTVTVPNAAHAASIRVRLTGSSGAGGAIGANESTQDAEYMVNVSRTAGLNAVATIGAVVGQAAAATVAGGNSVAVTGQLSAISGAAGATNTFTIEAKIARAGGSATNHTCLAYAELLNTNSSGVTIA